MGKLVAAACWAAMMAFGVGLCLGHTVIKHVDVWYSTGLIASGAALVLVLHSIRRAVGQLATARQQAHQFLWSCVFFAMLSTGFGIAVAGWIWYASDFVRSFGAIWFGALTCVGIFLVRRDAKRAIG